MQRYTNRPKAYITKAAQTFSERRWAGKSRAVSAIRDEEWMFWPEIEKEAGQGPGGILGMADRIFRTYTGRFKAFPLHLWRRRDLWNRLRWLKGELTRIVTREVTFKTKEERLTVLLKRRTQIATYEKALLEFQPLHTELKRLHRLDAQAKRRLKARTAKRKAQIEAALNSSKVR